MTGSIPDPRLEAAAKAIELSVGANLTGRPAFPDKYFGGAARSVLDAIDAADEASGVRRVTVQEPAGMLREFHAAYGLPVAETPTLPPAEVADLRYELLVEEFREYRDALAAEDMIELADALADMVYVIYGTALTYGIDLDSVLAEVHRSNMSKLGGDGKPVLRADGKVMKGPTYFRPDIRRVLYPAADSPVGGVS